MKPLGRFLAVLLIAAFGCYAEADDDPPNVVLVMADAYELYNLIGDPQEQQNLIEQQTQIAARMRAELDAWSRSVDASITGADYAEGRVLPSGRKPKETTG